MKISQMTACFGRLQGERLAPGPGLNIITAPNEGGKSTWCAFLRAMFYGIDTKERDTKTSLAEKNRWQPWSGAPMEGEMALTWRGRDIVLRRFARGSIPFGRFSAADAATGAELTEFTGETAGETLLGVSRSVYERSAFIGQGTILFSGERELERRIAALVSSGEETVSYSQAEERLRQWQRRRKYNKAGLIPRLEEELAAVEETLGRVKRAHLRHDAARLELEQLEAVKQALEAEQELHRRLAQKELDRQYAEAQAELKAAQEEEQLLRAQYADSSGRAADDPRFPDMTPDEAWARAVWDAAQAERLSSRQASVRAADIALLAAGILLVIFGVFAFVHRAAPAPALGVAGIVCAALAALINRKRRKKAAADRAALLTRYGAAVPEDIRAAAAAYREACARAGEAKLSVKSAMETAAARREGAQKLARALAGSGGQAAVASEMVMTPKHAPSETSAQLAAVGGELSRLGSDLAMAQGELNTLGSPAALAARREEIREELVRRRQEYDAITLALEELAAANAELQARFSPVLNARAGELMTALTGGKYHTITLTRDFQAMAAEAGGVLPRRAATLSQGTVDQLYLSVRLAVCELALPEDDPAPLVLDDALASFDGKRMALALDLLHELGETRQILLFSCHRREHEYLTGCRNVTLIDLQS